MPIDRKYGRILTERGTIGPNEPVVVFRAQDRLLPKLLKVYRYFCELAGSPEHHLRAIDQAAADVKGWQENHFTQTPQSTSLAPEPRQETDQP
jgi:hypothetical protein